MSHNKPKIYTVRSVQYGEGGGAQHAMLNTVNTVASVLITLLGAAMIISVLLRGMPDRLTNGLVVGVAFVLLGTIRLVLRRLGRRGARS